MSGQSITDRITAAQHSVTGSAISRAVCKATTHELSGPKKKHLDYLIHCTCELNVSIPQLADTLFERTANSSWVVVFKALITTHHLMMYGNERFIQYLASKNSLFNLNNFLDKGAVQGYDMSTFIRRYSRYLNEKALSYRLMAVDFTKMKRGVDGVMRTMSPEKLIKTLPIIQNQLDALLDFQASPNELTNGVVNAAFMLLFKDSIRLFAAYNEGIINLLEKYFDMKKNQCKDALDLYKKFLLRMSKLSEFLKVAEQVGIEQGDIPDLAQAPSSLLEALEQHLASLDGKKTKELSAVCRTSTVSSGMAPIASTDVSISSTDEKEKQLALEEERARLQALKDQQLKERNMQTPPSSSPTSHPPSSSTSQRSTGADLFISPAPFTSSVPNVPSDLLDLQPAFIPTVVNPPISTVPSNAWGGLEALPVQQTAPSTSMNVDFDAIFGSRASSSETKPSDAPAPIGDFLKPAHPIQSQVSMPQHMGSKLLPSDLDASLASLVGNLQFGGSQAKKPGMQWVQPGEKKLTGGTSWQPKTLNATGPAAWTPAPIAPAPMPLPHMGGMFYTGYTLAPLPFPVTATPQVPLYGVVPPQMGHMAGVPMLAPQPMMYSQPMLRPTNPFAPVPGAQMQFM